MAVRVGGYNDPGPDRLVPVLCVIELLRANGYYAGAVQLGGLVHEAHNITWYHI